MRVNTLIIGLVVLFFSGQVSAQLSKDQCNSKGKSKIRIGDYQGAMQYFEFGLIDDPKSAALYNNIANIYYLKGYHKKAQQHYSKAIIFDNTNADLHYNRGLCYIELGEMEKAKTDFKTVLSIDKKHDAAYGKLAECLVKSGNYAEALEYVDSAISISDKHFEYFVTRSECILNINNEITSAIKDLDTAINLAPDRSELYQKRGELHLQMGEKDAGKEDLKMAKSMNKRNMIIQEETIKVVFL